MRGLGGSTAFLYHDDFLKYQFGPHHPFQPVREKMTLDTLRSLGAFDGDSDIVVPRSTDVETLMTVHFDWYIERVRELSAKGGLLDQGDTPASPGLYEGAVMAVGATVDAARGIAEGEFDHAFNPAGGLHHAYPARASGFCVFNDMAVAVRVLQREYGIGRIAVIDIDAHHGDGTQAIFYDEDVLTISLHRFGDRFFPGSGEADETGELEGAGRNINVPLPGGTDDNLFLHAFRSVAIPALQSYRPDIIIQQFGVDGHYRDPLADLGYTTRGYAEVARLTHELAHELCEGRYLVVGGGGYDLDATMRTWSIMYSIMSEAPIDRQRLMELHDWDSPLSDRNTTLKVLDTIEEVKQRSLPLLEMVIRYA
ncbi:MAG: acetoin utilization protein AcuC [Methanomassiliicoccaceae archaeon]|nr:acetoin utilization protein AcuC [Euryarchaeota archaeon]HOB38669.1 acetoin utilization protein AcuC [Methanomassiliicoccaceae archaeon]